VSADELTEAIIRQLQLTVDGVTLTWREAHARARLAYEHWCLCPGAAAYALFRAAQDQADSAQDELHAFHARTGRAGGPDFDAPLGDLTG